MADVLKRDNYRVFLSSLLEEALDMITLAKPALLITDLHMKAIPAGPWIRAVRSLSPDLPILVLTALPGPGELEFARSLGVMDCISSPCESDVLRSVVRDCIAKSRLHNPGAG